MSETVLHQAHREWARRPSDERYESIAAMKAKAFEVMKNGQETEARVLDLKIDVENGAPVVIAPEYRGRFTHWSFGQLCSRVAAPGAFLRTLTAETVATVLNEKIGDADPDDRVNFFHRADTGRLLAATSDSYARVWNYDVLARVEPLVVEGGWKTPLAAPRHTGQIGTRKATAADVMACSYVREGQDVAPAGLYMGDRDLFCFFVNPERRIDDGSEHGLFRGFFLANSEVGAKALTITEFLFRGVCQNHYVWGASGVRKLSIRHVGQADHRARQALLVELREYADAGTGDTEAAIKRLQTVEIAKSKDEVVAAILSKSSLAKLFSQKKLEAAYDACEAEEPNLSPRSPWGMASGLTSLSQDVGWMDERSQADKAAGALLAAY